MPAQCIALAILSSTARFVLVSLDGSPLAGGLDDLLRGLTHDAVGRRVRIGILRGGKALTVGARLREAAA